MGQQIAVEIEVVDDVVILSGDRSLTAHASETYRRGSNSARDSFTSSLADRLFDADAAIDHVFAQSNVVVVKRSGGWSETSIEAAGSLLENLFVYWDGSPKAGALPIGGEGRGLVFGEAQAPATIVHGLDDDRIASLRSTHYNATISAITKAHDSLWIMEVTPDGDIPDHDAGQYTTLGLGFWEQRIDDKVEDLAEGKIEKLARRSYSLSSSILDGDGNLLQSSPNGSLEFYVVLVQTDWRETPAILTPRLFVKDVGDRVFLGNKIAGRYRLDKQAGIDDDFVFLSTGTGEAPHNNMILELLRDGHRGRIVSVCTSRYLRDLAYLEIHKELMVRFDNYQYIPMTTREPQNEGNKIYIQDLIRSGDLETALGRSLDPATMHFYLCGNPKMIGVPKWEDDVPLFPEPTGVVEILTEYGFTGDRRGHPGNVHYEEYW